MSGIFITDLDGTLLRSDQTLSDYTVKTLSAAMAEGCVVSFATARGLISAMGVVSRVPWKYPVILYNGALLYDIADNRVIDGYWLGNEATADIIGRGLQHGLTPFYFLLDAEDCERVHHLEVTAFGMGEFLKSRAGDPRFREQKELTCSTDHRTLALTYIGLREELLPLMDEVTKALGDQVSCHIMKDYYIDNHYFLEFSHALASKKEGLNLWAAHMGVDTGDICIFGDNLNDLGLFEAGGRRIAVANSHPDILKLADEVADSNNDDGVAKYIGRRLSWDGT